MAVEIDYNYKVDGLFESIDYYRSESDIDPNNLPAPTMSGIIDTTFTDTTAEVDKQYKVRFVSRIGAKSKTSDQIEVNTNLTLYLVNLRVINGVIVDSGTLGAAWTKNGAGLAIGSDRLIFNNSADSYLLSNKAFSLQDNFKMEIIFKRYFSTAALYPCLFSNHANGVASTSEIFIRDATGTNQNKLAATNLTGSFFSYIFLQDVEYKILLEKTSSQIKLYVNDELQQTLPLSSISRPLSTRMMLGHNLTNASSARFVGEIKSFKVFQ